MQALPIEEKQSSEKQVPATINVEHREYVPEVTSISQQSVRQPFSETMHKQWKQMSHRGRISKNYVTKHALRMSYSFNKLGRVEQCALVIEMLLHMFLPLCFLYTFEAKLVLLGAIFTGVTLYLASAFLNYLKDAQHYKSELMCSLSALVLAPMLISLFYVVDASRLANNARPVNIWLRGLLATDTFTCMYGVLMFTRLVILLLEHLTGFEIMARLASRRVLRKLTSSPQLPRVEQQAVSISLFKTEHTQAMEPQGPLRHKEDKFAQNHGTQTLEEIHTLTNFQEQLKQLEQLSETGQASSLAGRAGGTEPRKQEEKEQKPPKQLSEPPSLAEAHFKEFDQHATDALLLPTEKPKEMETAEEEGEIPSLEREDTDNTIPCVTHLVFESTSTSVRMAQHTTHRQRDTDTYEIPITKGGASKPGTRGGTERTGASTEEEADTRSESDEEEEENESEHEDEASVEL